MHHVTTAKSNNIKPCFVPSSQTLQDSRKNDLQAHWIVCVGLPSSSDTTKMYTYCDPDLVTSEKNTLLIVQNSHSASVTISEVKAQTCTICYHIQATPNLLSPASGPLKTLGWKFIYSVNHYHHPWELQLSLLARQSTCSTAAGFFRRHCRKCCTL